MTHPRRPPFLIAMCLFVAIAGPASVANAGSGTQDPAYARPDRPVSVVAQAPAQPQGGFDFPEEEEEAPTWADDIRAQALDIALVAAFSVLAFVSFFRKSVRLKYVSLVAAVVFLGF